MIFTETGLPGAYLLELQKYGDDRGFFARAFCRREFARHGLNPEIAQANIGFSSRSGTLRGLHYQEPPHAEAKLVRCTAGAVYDVLLDLRPESPTFRQWKGFELSARNRLMLYVPEGFAHGYLTLAADTEVSYQVSAFYEPGAERGIRWNDPAFDIGWPLDTPRVISEKDQSWPDYAPNHRSTL